MHVSRIGLTPLKSARHVELTAVDLTEDGPVGDRLFCLVDRARSQVLRTSENPTLVQTVATWHAGVLTTELPAGTVADVPVDTDEAVRVDYWGRPADLRVVAGPWAAAYSEHLGRDVELARATAPGEVVHGASVSLVTSSSLDRVAQDVGPVDPAQLRTTFTLDTGDEPAFVEDGWVGSRVRLGDAEVEVRSVLARCAVIDLDPVTGRRAQHLLASLAGYRRRSSASGSEILFGVDAVVTRSGRVGTGDPVGRG